MLQGKGYPDIATRQLVCTLSDKLPMTYVGENATISDIILSILLLV